MSPKWIRTRPGAVESMTSALVAGTAAAAVGVVTFYLTRLVLSREPVGPGVLPGNPREGRRGHGGA